ncbi:MAG: MATE family efflux transporter, partial [Oscillospiraceae bacterium]
MAENINENKMGTAPMFALIRSMSLPAMLSMLVQALYNIVDSMFVSWYSTEALQAVSLAFPIQMLMISVGVGTGVGINSLVSRRLGEGQQEEANQAATHGIILAAMSWLLFLVFGLFFSRMFFEVFSQSPTIIDMGTQYLSIASIFSFGCLIQIAAEKALQATGKMIFPMVAQLMGAIINIILDPIFIFGWIGIPSMGIAGAAIATVIGQIVSMLFLMGVLLFGKHSIKLRFKKFRFRAKTVKDIYAVGFPSIIMQSIGSVLIMGMNAILATLPGMGVA